MSGSLPAREDAPRVAVVLVSFNTRDELLGCLDALSRHARLPLEVVVVDNASGDGSAEAVRRHHPGVAVVANRENLGFARACNLGLRATRAPFVLFLNSDAEVGPGTIEALLGLLEARPDVGIVGPRTRGADGSLQVSTGPDLGLRSEWRQRRLVSGVRRRVPAALAEAERRHAQEHEPGWVSGSCLLARREALAAVSGFDERFFLYEEDADLCRRVRARGWRVVFTPAAEVRHRLGRSMARAASRARLEYHRSHLLYYRTHNGVLATAALRLLIAARGAGALASALASADREATGEALAMLRLAARTAG